MMQRRLAFLTVCLFVVCADSAISQQRDTLTAPQKTATISGIVKDQYGDPLSRAEVVVQPGDYSAVTGEDGKFKVQATAGNYNVIFRHVGYGPEDFSWRARSGQGTELSIRLNPLPQALDTVVIMDSHQKAAGASIVSGAVYNNRGNTLSGVELQLLGTGRHATSYEKGEFFFAGLAKGDYVIRARRLGYTPTTLPIKIGTGEEHDLSVILYALPATLKTVEIREKSGFGKSAEAWEEFDRRQRWKSNNNYMIGRDVFGRLGKQPLDLALRRTPAQGLLQLHTGGYAPTSIASANGGGMTLPALSSIPGDVCILIDGVRGTRLPLAAFHANEIERVEVYAPSSDWSKTLSWHFEGVKGCEPVGFDHPLYFVIWMRGTS